MPLSTTRRACPLPSTRGLIPQYTQIRQFTEHVPVCSYRHRDANSNRPLVNKNRRRVAKFIWRNLAHSHPSHHSPRPSTRHLQSCTVTQRYASSGHYPISNLDLLPACFRLCTRVSPHQASQPWTRCTWQGLKGFPKRGPSSQVPEDSAFCWHHSKSPIKFLGADLSDISSLIRSF